MKFKNLPLWAKERFPAFNVFAAGMTYLAIAVCLQKIDLGKADLTWQDLGGWIIFTLHLLILRILDEHKDQESDQLYHQDRVLQRGLVDLATLRVVGVLSFLIVLIFIFLRGFQVPLLWAGFLVTYFWTFLMTTEFFAKDFLRPKVFLYSFSHLLISPCLVWWTGIWALGKLPSQDVVWLMGCSFFAGLTYEVARKSKGVEEDHPHEPSYSNTYKKITYLSLLFILGCFLQLCKLVLVAKLKPEFLLVSSGLGLVMLVFSGLSLLKFNKISTKKTRQYNEGAYALMGLEVFLTLIFIGLSS